MLASITPLGERGRQSRWGVTVGAFLIGALVAGAAAGAVLGLAGSVVLSAAVSVHARLAALALAALLALGLDASPRKLPGPRRQVDERWRDEYRGWVYGVGYGAQLGVGITTVVSSAATYLALFAAFLSGGAGRGALIVGVFGITRGLQPLTTARVRRPEELLALHAWLGRWRAEARRLGCALLGAITVLASAAIAT
jgi:hypothetical protein